MKIAVIGVGVVGQVLYKTAQLKKVNVIGFDPSIPTFGPIDEKVCRCDVAFVSVPTPTHRGEQDISALHDVMTRLRNLNYAGVICIRSTVLPGTCDMFKKIYELEIVHMPEFLTEAHAENDFLSQPIVWLSGEYAKTEIVAQVLEGMLPPLPEGRIFKHITDFKTTEMQKYFANCFKALKVAFSNEIYDVCNKVGINYENVRKIVSEVHGVGANHTKVPGPDGRGFAGMCFTKDTEAFNTWAARNGVSSSILVQAIKSNRAIRNK